MSSCSVREGSPSSELRNSWKSRKISLMGSTTWKTRAMKGKRRAMRMAP